MDRKNQHYVPKLYLRQFSLNGNNKQIGLFYLNKEIFKNSVPIKSQAKEDFFYGNDGYLENELSKLESAVNPCLMEILATNKLPKKQSDDYVKLLSFSITMANRTKDASEGLKEMNDKFDQEILSYGDQYKNEIEDLRLNSINPIAQSLEITAELIHFAFDLKAKLLINKTNCLFITSDNPVIKYNQYLESRNHPGGHCGIATKGLQIFFPISPNHMLCFYDDWAYKIGEKFKDVIEITNIEDIEKLNYLQVLNCNDHLYFNHEVNESYLRQLFSKAKNKRMSEYSTLKKMKPYFDDNGKEHILVHTFDNNLNAKLKLGFIVETKKAKKHIMNDFVGQLRNEKLRG